MTRNSQLSIVSWLLLIVASTLIAPQCYLVAQTKLRVYVFAGQSNCNGAGGRIARYKVNSSDVLSPYVYKMIPNVRHSDNNPGIELDWKKTSGCIPIGGVCEVGTLVSNLRYPFNSIFDPFNHGRRDHNIEGDYDLAVFDPQNPDPEYPDAYPDSHSPTASPPIDGFDGYIGAEAQFARQMRARHPNDDVAIIKVSAGSSSIKNWEPAERFWNPPPNGWSTYEARLRYSRDGAKDENEQYLNYTYLLFFKHLMPAVEHSMDSFDAIYGEDNVELTGFVWIQGESDLWRFDPVNSSAAAITQHGLDYQDSFGRMVGALRANYNLEMQFVICLTKGYINVDVNPKSVRVQNLQAVQKQIVNDDPFRGRWVQTDTGVTIISEFDEPPLPDAEHIDYVHWDSESLRTIGSRIYQKFVEMEPQ